MVGGLVAFWQSRGIVGSLSQGGSFETQADKFFEYYWLSFGSVAQMLVGFVDISVRRQFFMRACQMYFSDCSIADVYGKFEE
jgi:hypothetical protein